MNTQVGFSCANGNTRIGAHQMTCLPSGNWSAPMPHCETIGEHWHEALPPQRIGGCPPRRPLAGLVGFVLCAPCYSVTPEAVLGLYLFDYFIIYGCLTCRSVLECPAVLFPQHPLDVRRSEAHFREKRGRARGVCFPKQILHA